MADYTPEWMCLKCRLLAEIEWWPTMLRKIVTGNQEYIKIGNEATSKIATIVHQKR